MYGGQSAFFWYVARHESYYELNWATSKCMCWNPGFQNLIAAVLCLVAQSYPTLCDHKDCSSPGSSVHGILQARILESVAMPSSKESSQPRNWIQVSHTAGGFFTSWTTREAPQYFMLWPYLKIWSLKMLRWVPIGEECPPKPIWQGPYIKVKSRRRHMKGKQNVKMKAMMEVMDL